jgi:hypothetical protein
MKNLQLSREINFIGNALFGNNRPQTLVRMHTNFELDVFVTDLHIYANLELPTIIEGEFEDWIIKVQRCLRIASVGFCDFSKLAESLDLKANQTESIPATYREKDWYQLTMRAEAIDFTKSAWKESVPEEWGIIFYPQDSNRPLYNLLHQGSRDSRQLPRIFAGVDPSIYFKNRQSWTVASMLDRIRLITSTLILFAGSPLSYSSLIGRKDRDVKFIRVNFISNPNLFVCPSSFNGHAYIVDSALDDFQANFTRMIDSIFNDGDREKISIILSYFKELYTALHEETRLAFSFQLMEALAHLKKINIKNPLKNKIKQDLLKKFSKALCPTCYALISSELKPEKTDDFDQYIEKALDVVGIQNNFTLNPTSVKKIVKKYRNEVFHGNFFEDMGPIDQMIDALPQEYREDLPVLLQAVTSVIGVHFLIGLDFHILAALKRDMRARHH